MAYGFILLKKIYKYQNQLPLFVCKSLIKVKGGKYM